jgi:hypothetical protein
LATRRRLPDRAAAAVRQYQIPQSATLPRAAGFVINTESWLNAVENFFSALTAIASNGGVAAKCNPAIPRTNHAVCQRPDLSAPITLTAR